QSVQFFIFSKEYDKIATRINEEIHRGATILEGTGWYSKQPVKVVTVIARKNESQRIFRIVKEVDPDAFVSQSSVIAVYGKGFDVMKTK
ncbi:MAG TPA: YitT family protein, partial [Paludibacteraceae bacterium]|nr:YitT family protein [Paludibacteraceae bacterium]